MGTEQATAVVTYHRIGDAGSFRSFAERLGSSAAAMSRFKVWQHSILTSPTLDWSIAVTFHDELSLHDWLDRTANQLDDDRYRHSRIDLITQGSPRSEGVLLAGELVRPEREEDYITAAERLVELERTQPGYAGSSVFPAIDGMDERQPWYRVVRFRTAPHLADWLDSPRHHEAMPELEKYLTEGAPVTATTAFSTVRISPDGESRVTPPWKTYLMVLLVLYPTAVVQGRFVDPIIRTVVTIPWLAALASMMLNVALLVWLMMPLGSRVLRRWMDPVDGAGVKVSLLGVFAIVASFVLYLTVFLSLGFLPTVDFLALWRRSVSVS